MLKNPVNVAIIPIKHIHQSDDNTFQIHLIIFLKINVKTEVDKIKKDTNNIV